MKTILLLFLLLISTANSASAEPLVLFDGGNATPALVKSWKAKGPRVDLQLSTEADPKLVLAAIKKKLPGVSAKIRGGSSIRVTGLTLDQLLPKLSEIDITGDDDLFASAGISDDDLSSANSVRAKRVIDLLPWFQKRDLVTKGTVISVNQKTFPIVCLKVKMTIVPAGALTNKVKKNTTYNVKINMNLLKDKSGLDYKDSRNQLNIGAWYFKAKDSVQLAIDPSSIGTKTIKANAITRL